MKHNATISTAPRGHCSACGAPLRLSRHGLCSRCLMGAVFPGEADAAESLLPEEMAGTFPGFEIRGLVGRGGMGAIYEAWETGLERRVALKLLPPDLLRLADFFDRFQREARLMAQLDHPNVARVFGSGITDAGQAFIVMEFIEGVAVTEYAAAHGLNGRARLALFLQIAAGVEHAHQMGIVHRDLKPSNILVTEAALVKVIDFGLAKGLAQAGDASVLWHSNKASPGTPGYMSPEQLAGEASDTRADIYSLGMVLGELLRDQTATGIALAEWNAIIRKAVTENPAGRYPTVNAFAEEVRRHLTHQAVQALSHTRWYRLRKYGRRHRMGLAATALLALLAMLGVAGILRESVRARQAERLAADQSRRGGKLIGFMLDELHDKLKPVGRLDILESTVVKVEAFYAHSESAEQPGSLRHRARAMLLLGKIHSSQGLAESMDNVKESIRLYGLALAAAPGNDEWLDELAQAWNSLAVMRHSRHDRPGADAAYQKALEVNSLALAREPAKSTWLDRRASILHNQGSLRWHQGLHAEAEKSYGEALTLWQDLLLLQPHQPEWMEHLATLHQSMAQQHGERGDLDSAQQANGEALAMRRRLLALNPKDPARQDSLADILQNTTEVHLGRGELSQAEAGLAEYRPIREKLVTLDPGNAIWRCRLFEAWLNEGKLRELQGQQEAALQAFRQALDLGQALLTEGRATNEIRISCWWTLKQSFQLAQLLAKRESEAGNTGAAQRHQKLSEELSARIAAHPEREKPGNSAKE